jgi:hypothetical protein
LVFLAFGGAADMVSAAFRSTILQQAASDDLRGRLQGVFVVVGVVIAALAVPAFVRYRVGPLRAAAPEATRQESGTDPI